MSKNREEVLADALELSPIERAELIEQLLSSFEFPESKTIDDLWAKEVEDRIGAYEEGKLTSTPAKKVFDKIAGK